MINLLFSNKAKTAIIMNNQQKNKKILYRKFGNGTMKITEVIEVGSNIENYLLIIMIDIIYVHYFLNLIVTQYPLKFRHLKDIF